MTSVRDGQRWTTCALLLVCSTLVPASHGVLVSIAGDRWAFTLGTALLLVIVGVLPTLWPRSIDSTPGRARFLRAAPPALGGLALLFWVSWRLLPTVFAGPLDPNRGDMLVIIQHAITQFLAGGNPYMVHHVPWDAPLSYGPPLWMPFIVPHALRVDLRVLTLAAQLAIPACVVLAASRRAGQGHWTRAGALGAVGTALALNPEIMRFHSIGHTQVYWPLMLVLCATLAGARWTAAAVCLGLLVAARTTMLAVVPVFFVYLAVNRLLAARHCIAFALAASIPFVPFVVADPQSVWYAMVGVYLNVMKEFVWHSTRWAIDTYGVTGRLLERGLERYVEIAQMGALAVTYILAWRSMHRGGRPEPWMALALLVFSMTTLWPVIYLYFDVWILLTCGLLAYDGFGSSLGWPVLRTTASVGVLSFTIVLVAAGLRPGARYTLDIGDPATVSYTGGGFGRDEAVIDEGRTAVWIEGETARLRLPRAGWSGATIRLAIRPPASWEGPNQRVSAALNGRAIGVARLVDGWQEIAFRSRARDWHYGFNLLDLSFSHAVPSNVLPGDRRAWSAALDQVIVE